MGYLVHKAEPAADIGCGVGEGKSLMASRYFGSGSMVESDTLKPAKSILRSAN